MSLQGKTALILGGAKNPGALVARTLAAEGANIAIHYHGEKSASQADSLAKEIRKSHGIEVRMYKGDMTIPSVVKDVYLKVIQEFGKLDIMVNTVGMVVKKPMKDLSEQEYDAMFAVNSKSAFFITQEAANTMSDGGKIVNIVTALLGAYTGYYALYQGSKAPVEWFTKGLSKELMDRGISVNAIAPGPMDTPFFYSQETDESVAFLKSGAIGGRLTKIDDIAPLVKLLVTEGGWITGECPSGRQFEIGGTLTTNRSGTLRYRRLCNALILMREINTAREGRLPMSLQLLLDSKQEQNARRRVLSYRRQRATRSLVVYFTLLELLLQTNANARSLAFR